MLLWQSIVKWFVKQVWPEILALIKRLIPPLLDWLYEQIIDLLTRSKTREEESARHRAKEEELRAERASAPQDAEHHRWVAQMWREVAENLRQENERLKGEIEKFLADAKKSVESSVSSLPVDNVFEIENKMLKLKEDLRPALPPPSTRR